MNKIDVLNIGENCHQDHFKENQKWTINELHINDFQCTTTDFIIIFCDNKIDTLSLFEIIKNQPSIQNYKYKIVAFSEAPNSIHQTLFLYIDEFLFLKSSNFNLIEKIDTLIKGKRREILEEPELLYQFSTFNLKGNSKNFIHSLKLLTTFSRCEAPVLITGETGTGKENAARSVHYMGQRKDKAFIPVNCGALPDNLLESELFGFEKGAFTDAKKSREGLISIANNGTLFLDEIDSLSLKAQAALLRFLQTGEYRPIGSDQLHSSNIRLVAATNANLEEMVIQKKFREDLFFRLNVLQVNMPPLRERPNDIEIITKYLLRKYLSQYPNGPSSIHPNSIKWLQQQQWKGNVRELENFLLREFLLSKREQLVFFDHKENNEIEISNSLQPCSFCEAKKAAVGAFEKNYLEKILKMADGNISHAARLAGKERRALGKLIKKYQIDANEFKEQVSHSSVSF